MIRRAIKRIVFAIRYREWPWNIPACAITYLPLRQPPTTEADYRRYLELTSRGDTVLGKVQGPAITDPRIP